MQTLKTAVVVVLLLFVLYGGFVAINGSNDNINPELEAMVGFNVDSPDISGATSPVLTANAAGAASGGATADPWASFNSAPSTGFSSNPFEGSSSPAATDSASIPPIPPSLSTDLGSETPSLGEANELPNPAKPVTLLPPSSSATPPSGADAAAASPFPALPALPGSVSSSDSQPEPKMASGTSAPDFGIALPPGKTAGDGAAIAAGNEAGSQPTPQPLAPGRAYENAKENALSQAKRGQLREALATLSLFYNSTDMTAEQRQDMLDILDALAREVVYSRQHYLDIAYYPVPDETIDQVAAKFEIPVQILARINNLNPGEPIPTGSSVKVVPGPFRAEVDVTKNELTLFLGELYAGRYPISVGKDKELNSGDFKVVDKQRDRNYYSDGNPIAGNDPANPYGGYWIDLGNDICIHGSSADQGDERGCISLSPTDASDIFGMLAHGSQVTIVR